tara:strand:- start:2274 stop:2576 length:303 start_codon:yes stop_codon:yes gene_type:complete
MKMDYTFADLINKKFQKNFGDETANQIVLPIKGNRYISIVQNDKNAPYDSIGGRYGDYAERVEVAILDSDYNYVDDGTFEGGVKGYLPTEELALLLIKLT